MQVEKLHKIEYNDNAGLKEEYIQQKLKQF